MFYLLLLGYNLLFPVAWLLALPGAIRRTRLRGGAWDGIYERFGLYGEELRERARGFRGKRVVWVHAVSVGEAQVAARLAKAILARDAGTRVALSTSTPTGQEVARAGLGAEPRALTFFAPFDFPPCVFMAYRLIRPTDFVLTESELWPNLLTGAAWSGVPVTLANARLSPRSAKRYRALRWLAGPLLRRVDQMLVTDAADAPRWEAAGFPGERIQVAGNLKYDTGASDAMAGRVEALRGVWERAGGAGRKMVLGASTHPGEEGVLADAAAELRKKRPDLVLFLVPRHAERADEVERELAERGLAVARRSRPGDRLTEREACYLLDVTGELAAWQHLADIVVVGKSFRSGGGQNPAEAPLAGKPVVFGPDMRNFEALAEGLLDADAAVRTDETGLAAVLERLLDDPGRGRAMAARGQAFLAPHAGAADRAAALILVAARRKK